MAVGGRKRRQIPHAVGAEGTAEKELTPDAIYSVTADWGSGFKSPEVSHSAPVSAAHSRPSLHDLIPDPQRGEDREPRIQYPTRSCHGTAIQV